MNRDEKVRISAKLDRLAGELARLAIEAQRLQARPTAAAGWLAFDLAEDFRAAMFYEHPTDPLAGLESMQ